MRLSERERTIIGYVETRPFATASAIAKALKMRPHQVSYAFRSLVERGVLRLAPVINIWRLGFHDIGVFFSLLPCTKAKRDKLIRSFIEVQGLAWLGSLVGQFEYGAVFMCRHPAEIHSRLADFEDEFGPLIASWSVAPRTSFVGLNRGYLTGKPSEACITFSYSATDQLIISDTDVRTLEMLANKHYTSFRELARSAGVSYSTFDERKSSLQRRGVVTGFVYLVESEALEVHAVRLLLTSSNKSHGLHLALLNFAKEAGNILEVARTLGRWDYEILVELSNLQLLSDVIGGLHRATNGCITNIEVLTHAQDLHFSLYPFKAEKARTDLGQK